MEEVWGELRFSELMSRALDLTGRGGLVDAVQATEALADELHIALYEPDSGSVWWQSYFVATPSGLSQILRDKSWKYLHAPEILVLPRYDLEEIRRAAASRIVADHEFFKARPESEEAL